MNMNMMNPNVILSLPVNFSSPQRASQAETTEPNKNFGRKDTGSTAATDLTSSFRSSYSIGTNDDFDGFIASIEASAGYCHDADATTSLEDDDDEEEVLMKLMSYQQGREIIQPGGGAHHGTTTTPTEKIKKISVLNQAKKFDSLAIKVARLEENHKRFKMQMRRMKHQVRILDAKNEYLECLEALALSSSTETELLDDEFLRDHGLVWKEVEFGDFE